MMVFCENCNSMFGVSFWGWISIHCKFCQNVIQHPLHQKVELGKEAEFVGATIRKKQYQRLHNLHKKERIPIARLVRYAIEQFIEKHPHYQARGSRKKKR